MPARIEPTHCLVFPIKIYCESYKRGYHLAPAFAKRHSAAQGREKMGGQAYEPKGMKLEKRQPAGRIAVNWRSNDERGTRDSEIERYAAYPTRLFYYILMQCIDWRRKFSRPAAKNRLLDPSEIRTLGASVYPSRPT
jgi:hypothetical protein